MTSPFNIIIFSRNRACQLHLLLESMQKLWAGWSELSVTVLFRSDSVQFSAGYYSLILNGGFDNVKFTQEIDFNPNLLTMIDPTAKFTVFLCDDDIFIRPFDVFVSLKPDEICLSLRLAPGLTYSLPGGVTNTQPEFDTRFGRYRFVWQGLIGDYGYPMSLDGHFFRTADILPIIRHFNYHNPNELEYVMSQNPIKRKYMRCMVETVVMNVPMNQVQTMWQLPHGDDTPESLNERYLQGDRLDFEQYKGYNNTACHEILPAKWVKINSPESIVSG